MPDLQQHKADREKTIRHAAVQVPELRPGTLWVRKMIEGAAIVLIGLASFGVGFVFGLLLGNAIGSTRE